MPFEVNTDGTISAGCPEVGPGAIVASWVSCGRSKVEFKNICFRLSPTRREGPIPIPEWEGRTRFSRPYYLGVYFGGIRFGYNRGGQGWCLYDYSQRHMHVNLAPGSVVWLDPDDAPQVELELLEVERHFNRQLLHRPFFQDTQMGVGPTYTRKDEGLGKVHWTFQGYSRFLRTVDRMACHAVRQGNGFYEMNPRPFESNRWHLTIDNNLRTRWGIGWSAVRRVSVDREFAFEQRNG